MNDSGVFTGTPSPGTARFFASPFELLLVLPLPLALPLEELVKAAAISIGLGNFNDRDPLRICGFGPDIAGFDDENDAGGAVPLELEPKLVWLPFECPSSLFDDCPKALKSFPIRFVGDLVTSGLLGEFDWFALEVAIGDTERVNIGDAARSASRRSRPPPARPFVSLVFTSESVLSRGMTTNGDQPALFRLSLGRSSEFEFEPVPPRSESMLSGPASNRPGALL